MIKSLPTLTLKPLTSISPSQLNRLDGCALQVVMQKSQAQDMLPPGAMTYFGNAVHKIIELATKGELTDEPAITARFEELIAKAEAALLAKGWAYLVPLKLHITDFALRRKQAIRRALSLVPTHVLTTGVSRGSYLTEQQFESVNKKVVGYIDAIRMTPEGVEIVDYKSGAILDETGLQVKRAYQQQLWLYAYLYWERYGIWPVRLLLIGLTGTPIEVPYSSEDAINTYQNAVASLDTINKHIQVSDWLTLAVGSESTVCTYCSVRPACPAYALTPTTRGFSDVAGVLSNVRQLANSCVIQLASKDLLYTVVDIPAEYMTTLVGLKTRPVKLIGTRAIGENRYGWLGQTVLFWE